MDIASIQAAYRRYAKVYDATFGTVFAGGRSRLMTQLNRRGGQRILEVGVGTGISLPDYRRDNRVVGIDISPDMLRIARDRVEKHGLGNVEALLEMDAQELDFETGSFDTVVAMYVMTVVPDPDRVLSELRRVCRPGGDIFVLNHFIDEEEGVVRFCEKMLSRFSTKLGWRPDVSMDSVVRGAGVELVATQKMPPFGLFHLLRFRNVAAGELTASYRLSPPTGGSRAGPELDQLQR